MTAIPTLYAVSSLSDEHRKRVRYLMGGAAAAALLAGLIVPGYAQEMGPDEGGGLGGGPKRLFAIGNTAGQASSGVAARNALTVSGAGGLSAGLTGNTLLLSGGAGLTSGNQSAIGNTTALTSSQTAALSGLTISGAGGLSAGFSSDTLVLSGATGGGGGNGVTQSLLILPNVIAAAATETNAFSMFANSILNSIANSASMVVFPIQVPQTLSFQVAQILNNAGATFLPISGGASSGGIRSASMSLVSSELLNIYSETAVGQFSTIQQLTNVFTIQDTLSENGSSWSETDIMSVQAGPGVTASTSVSASNRTSNLQAFQGLFITASMKGIMKLALSAATTIPPGMYLGALFVSSASTTAGAPAFIPIGATWGPNNFMGVLGEFQVGGFFGNQVVNWGYAGIVPISQSASFPATAIVNGPGSTQGQIMPYLTLGLGVT